jgi:hypothetical protein
VRSATPSAQMRTMRVTAGSLTVVRPRSRIYAAKA